ncbi:unnamed protein product [Gongylonema pulchrum]|uniref:non-specific serine/threonine protein kinase n=1 Tax=Gongylonema pulchrum TaxID=637853 RepID=A0A183D1C0_9BILA|nr:unnamed protein product [Gongylonema pulchrum]
MKRRIKAGEYTFHSPDWDCISDEAKNLVRRLLVTDPDKRMTIKEFMRDPWIRRHKKVPKSILSTPSNLNEETVTEIEEALERELTSMRILDNAVILKPIVESKSNMLERRKGAVDEILSRYNEKLKSCMGSVKEVLVDLPNGTVEMQYVTEKLEGNENHT